MVNKLSGWSFAGVDCTERQYDAWHRLFSRGSCPWCEKKLSRAFGNDRKHTRACSARPTKEGA